ncbi:MAG: hypothetical protein KJO56_13005 [Gammaproteobacteria bacterium]|nr:hypothetical protein [Gammaproteobacteria bacterium]MBT8105781.1 hypothetical protein [Gammaproteobacteria bacterium]NNF48985.1 hypothetical protein [Woeseiaceae bacterium]NNK25795.1 hypothetical protein [Woeseiaceae bacterium]NNL63037.1 hypothetical protein [Woeseiaceae bacterium]
MHQTRVLSGTLTAFLTACASEAVLLNSERIEQRFGNYGIELLESEDGLRRSNLYSREGNLATCRTYALVEFTEQLDERYADTHATVLAGGSIGATARERGWEVHKHTAYIGQLRLPERPTEVRRLMRLRGGELLAVHVYRLILAQADNTLPYATIIEIHHPDYLDLTDLRTLYVDDDEGTLPAADIGRMADLLFSTHAAR